MEIKIVGQESFLYKGLQELRKQRHPLQNIKCAVVNPTNIKDEIKNAIQDTNRKKEVNDSEVVICIEFFKEGVVQGKVNEDGEAQNAQQTEYTPEQVREQVRGAMHQLLSIDESSVEIIEVQLEGYSKLGLIPLTFQKQ